MKAPATMAQNKRPKEEKDRLSMLTDDILLSILGRLRPRVAARTSVLSTRWRYLHWSLPLSLDVDNFLSVPCTEPNEENDMEELVMASFTKTTRTKDEEDRISVLTDDILLSILGRLSRRVAARTSVLSTRWRHLPWLLPKLRINVEDFLSSPCTQANDANDMAELAMASFTKATRSLLANQKRESPILSLHLELYLINTFMCQVGSLVGEAVDNGLLKHLDLTVLDETKPLDCSDEEMLERAQEIYTFFSAYPSVLRCLTKLSLYSADFDQLDMHHVLFDCCKQLKHLSLSYCDTGPYSVFKIDAPNSELCVLETDKCRFDRIDLVCLPKLQKFVCIAWESQHVPVTFGFVPALGKLKLSCGASYDQLPFKLSELLRGVTGIHTLTLDFQGEALWCQPEMYELRTAFYKLKKLSLRGIFVDFDILWTMAFLVAAPSIEKLRIQVWEHACGVGEYGGVMYRESNRVAPQWEMRFGGYKNRLLKELEFGGFRSLEQQFTFIRSMLERSPNLQKIILRGCEDCGYCDARDASFRLSKFPKKDDQEMVVERIRGSMFSPEIIFDEDWSLSI